MICTALGRRRASNVRWGRTSYFILYGIFFGKNLKVQNASRSRTKTRFKRIQSLNQKVLKTRKSRPQKSGFGIATTTGSAKGALCFNFNLIIKRPQGLRSLVSFHHPNKNLIFCVLWKEQRKEMLSKTTKRGPAKSERNNGTFSI